MRETNSFFIVLLNQFLVAQFWRVLTIEFIFQLYSKKQNRTMNSFSNAVFVIQQRNCICGLPRTRLTVKQANMFKLDQLQRVTVKYFYYILTIKRSRHFGNINISLPCPRAPVMVKGSMVQRPTQTSSSMKWCEDFALFQWISWPSHRNIPKEG